MLLVEHRSRRRAPRTVVHRRPHRSRSERARHARDNVPEGPTRCWACRRRPPRTSGRSTRHLSRADSPLQECWSTAARQRRRHTPRRASAWKARRGGREETSRRRLPHAASTTATVTVSTKLRKAILHASDRPGHVADRDEGWRGPITLGSRVGRQFFALGLRGFFNRIPGVSCSRRFFNCKMR